MDIEKTESIGMVPKTRKLGNLWVRKIRTTIAKTGQLAPALNCPR